MPSVLDQFRPSRDSTSGEGGIFSRFFNEYCTVTTPTPWGHGVRSSAKNKIEGGVPDLRTGRAEKPIPSASDPSTCRGRLWRGEDPRVGGTFANAQGARHGRANF